MAASFLGFSPSSLDSELAAAFLLADVLRAGASSFGLALASSLDSELDATFLGVGLDPDVLRAGAAFALASPSESDELAANFLEEEPDALRAGGLFALGAASDSELDTFFTLLADGLRDTGLAGASSEALLDFLGVAALLRGLESDPSADPESAFFRKLDSLPVDGLDVLRGATSSAVPLLLRPDGDFALNPVPPPDDLRLERGAAWVRPGR